MSSSAYGDVTGGEDVSESKPRFCGDCNRAMGEGENRKTCKTCKKACCHSCIKTHDTPNAVAKQRTR
jgi:hypothetical protein